MSVLKRAAWALVIGVAACGGKAIIDDDGSERHSWPQDAGPDGTATGHPGGGGTGGTAGGGGSGGSAATQCGGGLVWAWTAGTPGWDTAEEVASIPGGVIVVGSFGGTMALPGASLMSAGGSDGFVARLDLTGAVLWSRTFGGPEEDEALGVAVDGAGHVLIAGRVQGTVDLGGGPLTPFGEEDAFVVKLAGDGHHLWSRRFGSPGADSAEDVSVDGAGNVWLAGSAAGAIDFGGGPEPWAGESDAFVTKLDPDGGYLWSMLLGDDEHQLVTSIAADSAGSVVVTGTAEGMIDFGGGPLAAGGNTDAFVAKLDGAGQHLWSHGYGDGGQQDGYAVAIDSADHVALTGLYGGSVDFGGQVLNAVAARDIFLLRLDPAGSLLWAQSFGDEGIESVRHVDVTETDDIVLTGPAAGGTDYGCGPVGGEEGSPKASVVKLSPSGDLQYATVWGDSPSYGHQYAQAAADDGAGGVVVVGVFHGGIQIGSVTAESVGQLDLFVARLAGLP